MNKIFEEKKEGRLKEENRLISVYLKIIQWGVYLILFTPLIISSKFFSPFIVPKTLYFWGLTEVIFCVWIFLIFSSQKYHPRPGAILKFLVLFLIILTLSSVLAEDPSKNFWSTPKRMAGPLTWFHLVAFFVVVSSVFQKMRDWFKIFTVSICVATLVSLLYWLSRAGVNFLDYLILINRYGQGGSTIGNSSFLAPYLMFNVFLAFYMFIKTTGRLKVFSGVALGLIALTLLFSQGYAAILASLGGFLLLFLLWLIFSGKPKLKLIGFSLLIVFLVGVTTLLFLALQPDNPVRNIVAQKTFPARLVVWDIAWKGWQEKFWLGWGPENFDLAFYKYFNPSLAREEYGSEVWFDRAHSIVFDTGVASGIVGLLIYLGIFISALYILWRKYFQKKFDFWTMGFFSTILISYFVVNLTVFDTINTYLMFILVLGFIENISLKKIEGIPSQKNLFKYHWLAGFILVFLIFSIIQFVIHPLQTHYYMAKALNRNYNFGTRVNLFKKALDTSPLGKYQIRQYFAIHIINALNGKISGEILIQELQRGFEISSQELEKSVKESPQDFQSWLRLGALYNEYSKLDPSMLSKGENALKKAIEISPANQQGYWGLAQTKAYQKNFQEAISLLEKAKEIEPRYGGSYTVIVDFAQSIGDSDLVKRTAQEAVKINPSWYPFAKKFLEE